MNNKIQSFRDVFETLQASLSKLNEKCTEISSRIEANELVQQDVLQEAAQAIRDCEEQYAHLSRTGAELSIRIVPHLEELSSAIDAFEKKHSTERNRATVLQFLRLNTDIVDIKAALDEAKSRLAGICSNAQDWPGDKLIPYEMIVFAVSNTADPLPKENFKRIVEDFDPDIVYAIVNKQLYIDNDLDITEYANSSCTLLILDKGEKNATPSEKRRWAQYAGYLPVDILLEIQDRTEEPTLEDIKRIEKQNEESLSILWNLANEKLFFEVDVQSGDSTQTASEAIDQLRDEGFLIEVTLPREETPKRYMTLASKGWSCFEQKKIRDYLARQRVPLVIPNTLTLRPYEWTPLSASRIVDIAELFRHGSLDYVLWRIGSSEMIAAKPVEYPGVTFVSGLFADEEENELQEIISLIDASDQTGALLIIVRSRNDAVILSNELASLTANKTALYFVLAGEWNSVFDSTGGQVPMLDLLQKHGTPKENFPESSGDADPTTSSETPYTANLSAVGGKSGGANQTAPDKTPNKANLTAAGERPDRKIQSKSAEVDGCTKAAEPDADSDSAKLSKQGKDPNRAELVSVKASMIPALNSIKMGKPSATKFKKTILALLKQHEDLGTILPLFTNLGFLERKQIFDFGTHIGHFEDSDKHQNHVNAAVDTLVSKGLLANYRLSQGEQEHDLYGLSSYCCGSMMKQEVDSMGIWTLSRGLRYVSGELEMEQSELERTFLANACLLEYLIAARRQYDELSYRQVCRSIMWNESCYSVDCFWDSEQHSCCLITPSIDTDRLSCPNLILCGNASLDDVRNAHRFSAIFTTQNEKIDRIASSPSSEHAEQIAPVQLEGASDIKTEKKTPQRDAPEDEMQEAVVPQKEDCSPEQSDERAAHTISTGLTRDNAEPPSDSDFCEKATALIHAPVSSEQELFRMLSGALMLVRTAGFIDEYSSSRALSKRLQLASSLLFGECTYSADDIVSLFPETTEDDQALSLAAHCFSLFMPENPYDYSLVSRNEANFEHFDNIFPDYNEFKRFYNALLSVKEHTPEGFTPAVVASIGGEDDNKDYIDNLRRQAKSYLEYSTPKMKMKDLPSMYKACFGSGSDLHECMKTIEEDRISEVDLVESVLKEYCSERNSRWVLDEMSIGNRLDSIWDSVNTRQRFKLEFAVRAHLIRQFKNRLEVMLDWIDHLSTQKKANSNVSEIRNLRNRLLESIAELENQFPFPTEGPSNILLIMLKHMKIRLLGQSITETFFFDLLLTGFISVDENGWPILNEAHTDILFNEPWRNVIRHIEAEHRDVSDVKDDIIGNTGDESPLLDNLNQLGQLGHSLKSKEEDYQIGIHQVKEATAAAELKTEKFRERLELAYTYNHINETEKETLSGIVDQNEGYFFEITDFACWRHFLEGLERQIEKHADVRQIDLRNKLQESKRTNPDSTLLKEAEKLLENDRNFAVTEEYLNRFESGETELSEELESFLRENDYFNTFLSNKVFNPLYNLCIKKSGTAMKRFGWQYLERELPRDWTSRQRKDSEELIYSWPFRKDATSTDSIKKLFTSLGLSVESVDKIPVRKDELYAMTVIPSDRSKADYLHPIASFGTQMKSPLHVFVLYGNHTYKELVDKITAMDLGTMTIVLIDRPIDQATRRLIGEYFHTQTSGQNPFLLIDQVLLLFLAQHQITERLPALLKCTLPYSTYQPFVQDSGSTSDEMFFGRTLELSRIMDLNGPCVVYGGRQLGKTALLQRAESRCMKPDSKSYAIYVSILKLKTEKEVVETISSTVYRKTNGVIDTTTCHTLKELCDRLGNLFRNGSVANFYLLIDEVDDFLDAISVEKYVAIQPLVDLRRETTNNFKFVIAGLHNVCRAKNATYENGIFGQLGTPLCIRPLSPNDALKLLSRPLHFLGFRIERYPHLETILTNTNYYPGIVQFFGYMLVETLNTQYSKYYRAANGNPPFTLHDDQLGAVMNSADINRSIKDKFRWSLELDKRYFMIARCITMLYHLHEEDRYHGNWKGFGIEKIIEIANDYGVHCLEKETLQDFEVLLDEMVDMGILSKPGEKPIYRLRRSSFIDIIGESIDVLHDDMISHNKEC